MDLAQFEVEWKEYSVTLGRHTVNLRSMLVRSRGTCTKGGYKAVNFKAVNEDVDPMFLRPAVAPDGTSYCMRWNDETEKWENIGHILISNEWSANQLKSKWQDCAIQLASSGKILNFRDIFSDCIGERYDGVCFVGKGRFDGENILLRLDREKQVTDYFSDQDCERYNEEKDEWEFWGMLIKRNPMRKK